jgi:hypothetical protein
VFKLFILLALFLVAQQFSTRGLAFPNAPTFDYYIGPRTGVDTNPQGVAAGLDSNPGTLAAPFAVTSLRVGSGGITSPNFSKFDGQGVRVGFLPGIYDISGLMQTGDPIAGGIQFPGGNATKINYFGSSNASGHYSPRTATFDGRGSSNLYGSNHSAGSGSWDGPIIAHTGVGHGSVNYTLGYLTIDGIRETGWSFEGIRIGGASYGGPATIVHPVLVTNCEAFYGAFNISGMVMTFTLSNGGSGYLPASGTQIYYNVPLTGGTGSNATADVTVTNGAVTLISAQSAVPNFANAGNGYVVNDTLGVNNATMGGVGSGAVITVNSVGGSTDTSDNCSALWLDHSTNCVTATNNWFHDSWGHTTNSGDHFNGIIIWGNSGTQIGVTVTYNTLVRAANIFAKEQGIEASIVTNNYVDMSNLTTAIGGNIQDFTGNSTSSQPSLSGTTIIANNVILTNGGNTAASFDSLGGVSTDSQNTLGWNTAVTIKNNTVVNKSSSGGAIVGVLSCNASTNGVGGGQFFNNIYVNPGGGSGTTNGNGTYRANPACLNLMDYNLNPSSGVAWALSSNSAPGTTVSTSTTYAAWATAYSGAGGISGVEANSILGVPTFTGSGLYAAQWQLQNGTTGQGAGRVGGLSSGAVTDMGAWGGIDVNTGGAPTQIGCSFAT